MASHWSDYASIVWNYFFGTIGVILNILLIYFIFKHTPQPMKVYATVIRVGAVCELIYAFLAIILSTRIVAAGLSLILIFHGAINYFPTNRTITPYVCFFFYIFGVNSYLLSVLIVLFSLYYRQSIVTNPQRTISQLQINCICYGFSFIVFIYTLYIGTKDSPSIYEIDALTRKERPGVIESGFVYYVLFDASGFSEWIVIFTNWIVLILGIVCRIRVYRKLSTLNMSPISKQIQKNLMNILLIQIITVFLPMFTTALHYIAVTWNEIQTPIIENLIFTLPMFLPSITPIATIYYIDPYRRAIKRYFRVENVQPPHFMSERLDTIPEHQY